MAEQTMDYDLKFDANTQNAIKKIDKLSQKTHDLTDNEHIVKFGAKIDVSDQAIQKVSAKIQQALKKTSVAPEITFDRIKLDEEKIKNSFASLRRQIQAAIKNQFSKIPPIDLTVNVSDSFKNLSKVASGLTQISNAAKGLSQTNIDKIKDLLSAMNGFNFKVPKIGNVDSFCDAVTKLTQLDGRINGVSYQKWTDFAHALETVGNAVKKLPKSFGSLDKLGSSLSSLLWSVNGTDPSKLKDIATNIGTLTTELGKLDVSKIKGVSDELRKFKTALTGFEKIQKIDWKPVVKSLDDFKLAIKGIDQFIVPLIPGINRLSSALERLKKALTNIGSVTRGFGSFITQLDKLSKLQITNSMVSNFRQLFDAFAKGLSRLTNLQQLIRDLSTLIPAIMRLASYLRQCNSAINGLNRATGAGRRGLGDLGNAARHASESFNFLTRSMQSTISDIRRVAAMVYVIQNTIQGVKGMAEQLDRLNVVKNKIRGLYESEEKAVEVTDMIYRSAQDARTSMDAFSTTFLKVQLATEKYGFTAQEAVDMTNTLAKALTIGGATASETASVMLQMSQALSKGKLDGDEFRSVMENSPVLMRALAREAGKAMGVVGAGQKELMQWSRTGKLTIDILLNALKNMKGEMDRKFNGTTETITQAFAKLDNAWEKFIGTFAEEGALENIRDIIGSVATMMEKWGRGIINVSGKMALITAGIIAYRAAMHTTIALQTSLTAARSRYVSVMTGELAVQQQIAASEQRMNAAMTQANSIMNKQAIVEARLTKLEADRVLVQQALTKAIAANDYAAYRRLAQIQREIAAEKQRVLAIQQTAAAINGQTAAINASKMAVIGAVSAVGKLTAVIGGLMILNEILNLWTRWAEVSEQTERAIKGNADAIAKFGKGGELEGWRDFYEILKGISGIDFGNLKDIDEGAAAYVKFKAGLIDKEEYEKLTKKKDEGVRDRIKEGYESISSYLPVSITAVNKVSEMFGFSPFTSPVADIAEMGIAANRRSETVKSGMELKKAIQEVFKSRDFIAATSQNAIDAYGEKVFDSHGFEVFKTDILDTLKDQEAFLNGAGKEFLSKISDTMTVVTQKGTGAGVLTKEDREAYSLTTGLYATLQEKIAAGTDKTRDYTAVVDAIQRLAKRFESVKWENINDSYKDQESSRMDIKQFTTFNETIKKASKTMLELGMSYDKMQYEISDLIEQANHLAEINKTTWVDELPNLLQQMTVDLTGKDSGIQEITNSALRIQKTADEEHAKEANSFLNTYKQTNDDYILRTKYWIDAMDRMFLGFENDYANSVMLTPEEVSKIRGETEYQGLTEKKMRELKAKNPDLKTVGGKGSTDGKKSGRAGGGGGGRHKDEFKIDWLNMVGLGGNIYDSYHPSKILKTFEEAVPGGNRNLIGVDRDAEKWYEEVAKIKEQALEKGVKLTEQDYAELKTLWDQRQELEKILDVKRQITDDINKPMEEYENQKKALEQLIAQMQALGRDTSLYEKKLRECRKPMEELGKAFAEGLQKNMLSDFGRDVFDRFEKLLEAWEKQEKKAADKPQIEKLMKQAQIEEFKLKASQKEGELTWGEGGKFWAANMGLRAENLGTLRAYNRGNLSQGAMAGFMRDNLAKYNAYSGAFGRTEDGAGFLSSMGLDPNEWNDWALRGLEAVSKLTDGFNSLGESITESLGSALTSFTDGLADGIAGAIVKGEDLRETMNNVAQSILTNIISAIIKMGIQWAATQLMMSVIGDTMKKKEELTNAESAAAIAAEWATAATYVSTATMGGAVAAGESALLTALATNQGLAFTGFADGGYTGNGDKYDPAGIVHKGEYVFTQDDVKRIGLNNLEMMHRGSDSVTNAGLNNNRVSATEQRSSSVSIVNMVDPDMLKAYLSTPDGQRAIINTIRHNPKTVKQIVTTA